MSIYVGAVLGDASRISDDFMQFLITLHEVKDVWHDQFISSSDGTLDLVFHTEGKLLAPAFRGSRTGRFSRKLKTLQVQIALSIETLTSPNLIQSVADYLKAATALGMEYFRKKGIPFCLESHIALIDKIRDELNTRTNHG